MFSTVLDRKRKLQLESLASKMHVAFDNYKLLHVALTHTSFANENNVCHNERLEFLGDAVLDLIISEYLFRRFKKLPEGELTKARARLVCEQTLAKYAVNLDIGSYLLLGKGEAITGGRSRHSILADAFEAIVGAIYLDKGLEATAGFVLQMLSDEMQYIERGEYVKDFKTLLQETVQRSNDKRISYEVVAESGPDHDKVFEVAVMVNGEYLGMGKGRSKKEAEQHAARLALIKLNVIDD